MSHVDQTYRDYFRVNRGLYSYGDGVFHGGISARGDINLPNFAVNAATGQVCSLSSCSINRHENTIEYKSGDSGTETIYHPLSVTLDTLFTDDVYVKGDLHVDGNTYLSGGIDGIIKVGDVNTDNVEFNADINSNFLPNIDVRYDLGNSTQQWRELFVHDISATGDVYWSGGNSIVSNSVHSSVYNTSGDWDSVYSWVNSDSATNNTTYNRNTFVNVSGDTITGSITVQGTTTLDNMLSADDVHVRGDLRVDGDVWFNANNTTGTNTIYLGDSDTDNVVFNADVDSDIIPDDDITYNLGASAQRWNELHVNTVSATGDIVWSGGGSVVSNSVHNSVYTTSSDWNEVYTWVNTYSAQNNPDYNRTTYVNVSGDTMTGPLVVDNTVTINDTLSTEDVHVRGDLRVDGDVWFNANNVSGSNTIYLGDSDTDNVVFNADVDSDIIPDDDITYNLGASAQRWNELHVQNISATSMSATGDVYWNGGGSQKANDIYNSVTTNSANWATQTPVLHVMTRSALQITTPYGPTGEIVDWTPQNMAGNLSGWWDPSDTSTITTGTGTITGVQDKSVSGYDLTSTTGAPTGRSINGLTVLDYVNTNTSQDQTVFENNSFNWDQNTTERNVYMVVHFDDEGLANDQDFLLEGENNTNRLFSRVSGAGAIMVNNVISTDGVIVEGNTYLITLTINGGNSLIRVNGAQVVTGNVGVNPIAGLNIGSNFLEQQGLDGAVAEIVMSDDRSETELIEGYLAHKWNLTGSLSGNHTYKATAPKHVVQDHRPEFLAMQSDKSAGDAIWQDVNYENSMLLPYDATIKRAMIRGSATQGATLILGMHSNRDESPGDTLEYKFFPETPMESVSQTYTTNNESRVFTFNETTSAAAGQTLGVSLSTDRIIGHTNVTLVVEYHP